MRRLKLALVDREYSASDNFGHIRARIDRHDQHARKNSVHIYAQQRHTVIDRHGLHDHRRAAEKFDVGRKQASKTFDKRFFELGILGPKRYRPYHADHQADCRTDQRTYNRYKQRNRRAF
ncbi:hypothetical protein SDC9_181131 [bioreactor metagenome]|uniref:Uncharacterized protein n=1 Tax=bioreactor metagenome TaxID=1076179 RepID=A0A645H3M8_9ZZZZ